MGKGEGRGVLKSALNFEYPAKENKNQTAPPPPLETLVKKANFLKSRNRKKEEKTREISQEGCRDLWRERG